MKWALYACGFALLGASYVISGGAPTSLRSNTCLSLDMIAFLFVLAGRLTKRRA